jgi:hypothetical protein
MVVFFIAEKSVHDGFLVQVVAIASVSQVRLLQIEQCLRKLRPFRVEMQ